MRKIASRFPFQSIPPIVVDPPTIYGINQSGQVLTASPGVWAYSPASFAYQWQREGFDIAGAAAAAYTLTAADLSCVMTVKVVALNSAGPSLPAIGFLASLIKIMPLGDSLTVGTTVFDGIASKHPGGYRAPLWALMQNNGYNIAYVGSAIDMGNSINPNLPFGNHDGHGGYTISGAGLGGTTNIKYGIDTLNWLSIKPDIILLLIGINDFFTPGRTAAQANIDYSDLLDDILGKDPDVKIICSALVQRVAWADTFNSSLQALTGTKGPRVSFVDCRAAMSPVTPFDLSDGTHPTRDGYDKIAPVWEAGIEAIAPLSHGPVISTAVRYVSSSTGLDTNAGTRAAPWKTINQVNTNVAAGMTVLFKRGDVWRILSPEVPGFDIQFNPGVSGTALLPIAFGAYGIGANPILEPAFDASATAAWTNIGGNIWQSVQTFPPRSGFTNGFPFNDANDIGNILWGFSALGGSAPADAINASVGVMAPFGSTTANLTAQGDWLFKKSAGAGQFTVQVFSTQNPATAMPGLRLAIDKNAINTSKSFMTFQNLNIRFAGASAVTLIFGSDITFRDNIVQWIGGCFLTDGSIRYGDGINNGGTWSNLLIERCFVYQLYDALISPQSMTNNISNSVIRNNVFFRGGFLSLINNAPNASTVDGLKFYNNTWDDNTSWSTVPVNQRRGGSPFQGIIALVSANITYTNYSANNNTWTHANSQCTIIGQSPNCTQKMLGFINPSINYNIYQRTNGTPTSFCDGIPPDRSLVFWAPGTDPVKPHAQFEVNGFIDFDPQFTNQPANDLTPAAGSRLRNAGLNLFSAGVVWDFNKNPRPSTGPFTIGAFQ